MTDVVDLSFVAEEPVPALALAIGGALSVAIAAYGHRDDSHWDEVGTFFAFILGIGMLVMAFIVGTEHAVDWLTLVLIIVLALTLFLKPLREIPWAAVLGIIAGAAATYAAWLFLPADLFGVDQWMILVAVFLIVGAIVHGIFHFLEDVLTIASAVLDWRPVMVLVGLVGLAEGVLLLLGRSILSFF